MILALVLVVALAVGFVLVRRGGDGAAPRALGASAGRSRGSEPAERFFHSYVDRSGRVVRHDQGGDTVSEGQAYGMLLAVALGDRARFDAVWTWTRENLQREDGLLSWKWANGKVVDSEPATDADLDAARALVMAGRHFGDAALTEEGKRMGSAILDHETAEIGGELVLLPGPWAARDRFFNPSYVSPCSYQDLEEATGDPRWGRLAESSHRLVGATLASGGLPPDWARLDDRAAVTPTGPPDAPDRAPQYGADAARLGFRLAEDCGGRGPELSARLWRQLEQLDGQGAALAYSLDGKRMTADEHPVGLVGAAAAARAAGAADQSARLLDRAATLARRHPTYYGAAWVALGEALLEPTDSGRPSEGDAP